MQQRLVLFLNHVLMQEKEAMERLVRQRGVWRGAVAPVFGRLAGHSGRPVRRGSCGARPI
jgi:hypothetical protein